MHCPPHGGACSVGACPPRWLCVVWWCWAWVVVSSYRRPALLGSGWWCFSRRHVQLFWFVRRRLRRLTVGVFGWLWSAVRLWLGLCCLLGRGRSCAGAWPFSWWVLLRWCVVPPMVGRAVLVRAPRPLWGVLCRCASPPLVGRAVLACGAPHGRPCRVVVWPPSWWGVLCWCVAPLMVGRALLLPVRRGGCGWCGGAWLGLSSCVLFGGRRRGVRVGGACGGVLAGAMRGLFCLFDVVFAALRTVCPGGCGRQFGCGCGCVDRLAGVGSVLVRGHPHGGACCVYMCLPTWWGVLRWSVSPLMVGRAVLVCGPPHDGACCVGARGPRSWCVVWWCLAWAVVVCRVAVAVVLFVWPGLVLCWCVAAPLLGRAVFVCAPPGGGACCVGVCPPPWCGVLRWFVAPPMVACVVLVCGPLLGGACCVGACRPRWWHFAWVLVVCWVGCGCGCVVCLAKGWCCAGACPPPLLMRAVYVRAPPLDGACCVGVLWFRLAVL